MMRTAAMLALIRVPLRQHQREALAAFCGWLAGRYGDNAVTTWERSAMLQMVNAGDTQAVGPELLQWVYTEGHLDTLLVKRRIKERLLWEGRAKGVSYD